MHWAGTETATEVAVAVLVRSMAERAGPASFFGAVVTGRD